MESYIHDLVAPPVLYVRRLLNRLHSGDNLDVANEQASIKGLLFRHANHEGLADSVPGAHADQGLGLARARDHLAAIRRLLIYLVDELVLGTDELKGDCFVRGWNERKLETRLLGENNRASAFWEVLRTSPSLDVQEVGLLCIGLGFRGDLRDQPDELKDQVRLLGVQMAARHLPALPPGRDGEPPTYLPPLRSGPCRLLELFRRPAPMTPVDRAWQRVMNLLAASEIDLRDVPLYFVLGGGLTAEVLEEAVRETHQESQVAVYDPEDPGPLQVVACRQAVYVVWGAGRAEAGGAGREVSDDRVFPSQAGSTLRTIATPDTFLLPHGGKASDSEELRKLCRHVARARAPFPGTNGVLLTVPWREVARRPDANRFTLDWPREQEIIRNTLGLSCPAITVLTGLEQDPAFPCLVAGLGPKERKRRLGAGSPWRCRPGDVGVIAAVKTCLERFVAAVTRQAYEAMIRQVGGPEPEPSQELQPPSLAQSGGGAREIPLAALRPPGNPPELS